MSELYSLPNGWEWKKLGFFGIFIRGVTYKKEQLLEFPTQNSFTLLRANNIQEELNLDEVQFVPKELVKGKEIMDGDILFAMSSGSKHLVGKNIILNGLNNYTFGAFCSIYRNQKNDILDNNYLSYIFKSNLYREKLSNLSMGANINNLKSSDLEIMKIPLPPLEEQKRIVAKLDILFAKIDKAITLHQKNIDEADIFMASVLNDVFAELEEKYEKKQLNEIVDNYDGKRIPIKSSDRENIKGIYPYYGASGIIDYVNDYIFDGEYLLISEDGANLTVRKYPIAFIAIGKFWVNNHAHIVSAKKDISTNKFMEYAFAFTDISSYITGSAQPKMSQGKMNLIEFSLPPLKTQQKVVLYLDEISQKMEKIKQIQKKKMQSLKELKASILDKAFKGEL